MDPTESVFAKRSISSSWRRLTGVIALLTASSLQWACGSQPAEHELLNESVRAGEFWITVGQDTYFKNVTRNQSEISTSKACRISQGTRFLLSAPPIRLANAHTFVSLLDLPPSCDFSSGFFYTPHIGSSSSTDTLESRRGLTMKINRQTWLQRGTMSDLDLERGTEKCTLYNNSEISLQARPIKIWRYYLVALEKFIPGCDFSLGFVAQEDVTINEPPTQPTGSQRVNAFLAVIAYAEGTGSSYNIRFGGARFYGYNDHPRTIFCSGGLCSDAAGRYQFLSTTWDSLRRQIYLPDFSPASQDKAALKLIQDRGVGDINYIDRYQEFRYALWQLRQEWASLPDAPYGQPTKTYDELWNVYQSNL